MSMRKGSIFSVKHDSGSPLKLLSNKPQKYD